MTSSLAHAGAVLTIDLDAIVSNWRMLSEKLGSSECSAVVKANAYGLGATRVAAALENAGCKTFFVAHLDEGIELRSSLSSTARIFVLNGTPTGTEQDFVSSGLIPVVNSFAELSAWRNYAQNLDARLPIALQVDSGMSRLGLQSVDVEAIAANEDILDGLDLQLVMSHLACADEPSHDANEAQRLEFERLRSMLPDAPAALANSAGVFLGQAFHFNLARPGAALYGINPTPALKNPMKASVTLSARVVQIREVKKGAGIGYGFTCHSTDKMRLATISLGYADGWPRNAAVSAYFNGEELPFAGRVSMDSIILDISALSANLAEGDFVDLICPEQTVDDIAQKSGTIGYEILTRLGTRFHRQYLTES